MNLDSIDKTCKTCSKTWTTQQIISVKKTDRFEFKKFSFLPTGNSGGIINRCPSCNQKSNPNDPVVKQRRKFFETD